MAGRASSDRAFWVLKDKDVMQREFLGMLIKFHLEIRLYRVALCAE